jgi:predicted nucleic acid-binding protein
VILVDTSIWIDHLRRASPALEWMLERQDALLHPFVIGEMACGRIKNRDAVLEFFAELPRATVATHEEVMALIESRQLMGRGINYVDAHLLASAALTTETRLWTRDKRLHDIATLLNLAF